MPIKLTQNYKLEKDEQYVYLDSLRLKGVQNVSASYQKNLSLANYLGNNEIIQLPNGEPNGQCSINSLYLTSDPYIQYTGNTGSNFYLLRSQTDQDYDFSFSSGYMVSYSQQCGIGEIPSISTNWQVFGNIGTFIVIDVTSTTIDYYKHTGSSVSSTADTGISISRLPNVDVILKGRRWSKPLY